ncbi:unnamed protein product [Owenia fusiformis]|uniref:Fibrinogen C-terminal domain-containing protein n=1 Tax=Owenia fusiformis TaxID=6347 RepID=A0A8S4NWQ0_OWEFU|nr:unnamed protein product [Owenia fusiformis]
MHSLAVIIWLKCLYITLFCNKASAEKKVVFNNIGYSTKYYHQIGYSYRKSPMKTLVMSMAAYDMEIASVQCLSTCQKEANAGINSSCVAVNFHTENGTCELFHDQPVYRYNKHVIPDDNWTLYMEEALKYPRDCEDITIDTRKEYYDIQPDMSKPPFSVMCGDKSTTKRYSTFIQSHKINSEFDFQNATWSDYRNGFKNNNAGQSYYWIGNENLHTLTSSHNYSIKFSCLESEEGKRNISDRHRYIFYDSFSIGSEEDFYRLNIGKVREKDDDIEDAIWGTAIEEHINGSKFMTYENVTENPCARQGGWWYNNCTYANLNTANNDIFWGSLKCHHSRIKLYRIWN